MFRPSPTWLTEHGGRPLPISPLVGEMPGRAEGGNGIALPLRTATKDPAHHALPLRMRMIDRIARPVTMTTAISPSVSVPRKSTMMTFTTLAPCAIVLE